MGGNGTNRTVHPCTGCRHFYGAFTATRCCNYIFDTGMRRPCPPGKDCTVRDSTGIDKPRRSPPKAAPRQKAKPRPPKPQFTKICPICAEEFRTTYSRKLYCSDHCQEIASVRRKRRKRKLQRNTIHK